MKNRILHNIGLKITVFILAMFLWLVIGEYADPTTTKQFNDIPVIILNEEIVSNAGKVYQVIDNKHTVSVEIKAKTNILESIRATDIIATANFEEIEFKELIPVKVSVKGYEDNISVVSKSTPTNLKVEIEDSKSKKFPIIPSTVGKMNEDFALGDMTTKPETISISGPESVVESIAKVEAQVNIDEIYKDIVLPAQLILYDKNNLTIDQTLLVMELTSDLRVEVEVLDTKTVPIELDTSGIPKRGYKVADISSEPTEITIAGRKEVLQKTESIRVPGSALNINGLSGKIDKTVDILQFLSEDIRLFEENTNMIAVTVQIDKLGTKSVEIPVQSIAVYDNAKDMKYEYDGISTVMITFTGLQEKIADLDAKDVGLSIDLSDYTKPGRYNVPVQVTKLPGCEVVDEVMVPIVLTGN